MAHPTGRQESESDLHLWATKQMLREQVLRVGQRTEEVLRRTRAAQRAAADSVDKSADSHERTAKSYEELAERTGRQDDYLKHAARHRKFAHEDRLMAERLRQMATPPE